MTEKEIVQALRYCSDPNPAACNYCQYLKEEHCILKMAGAALDLIERLTAENAKAEAERDALLEIAKKGKDCDTCKHCEVCVQPGTDVEHWCNRCVAKCRCYECRGEHWEWRGLPEGPGVE